MQQGFDPETDAVLVPSRTRPAIMFQGCLLNTVVRMQGSQSTKHSDCIGGDWSTGMKMQIHRRRSSDQVKPAVEGRLDNTKALLWTAWD